MYLESLVWDFEPVFGTRICPLNEGVSLLEFPVESWLHLYLFFEKNKAARKVWIRTD